MTIRLNKVTRDLNVGITTAVEFLQKKGFTVEANPNKKLRMNSSNCSKRSLVQIRTLR